MSFFDESLFAHRAEYLIHVREMAQLHRRLSFLFLALLLGTPLPGLSSLIAVVFLMSIIRIMRELQWSRLAVVLLSIAMLVPVLNVIVLGVVNVKASDALRRAGLRVGFLGAEPHEIEHLE